MRQLFIDTETTGLEFRKGHRIIEFGALEMVDRKLTGSNLHFYFKPDIKIDPESFKVHGISNRFLMDKPPIEAKIDEIMTYIKGAELVIHNAPFDVAFLNSELGLLLESPWKKIEDHCTILDTLVMSRTKHPRQKNSLDALCERYGIGNSHRKLHGALRDAKILAQVYLMMTGGQTDLFNPVPKLRNSETTLKENQQTINYLTLKSPDKKRSLLKLSDIPYNCKAHKEYLDMLKKTSNKIPLWQRLSS